MDVEVFREGYLSGPLLPVNSVVPVGEAIAYLVNDAKQAVNKQVETPAARSKATPACCSVRSANCRPARGPPRERG